MNVNAININSGNNRTFGHLNPWSDSPYKKKEQATVATTTALGVFGSMALLAKHKGYSLSPKRMFKNLKDSYCAKVEFDELPVITIGAGSCLGGLIGGFMIDKDKENRKAKLRETILQITNISLPIIFTVYAAKLGKNVGNRFWDKSRPEPFQTYRTKIPKALAAMGGLICGVFCGNVIANKINEKIFHKGKGRPVQITDFSAHIDDMCVAAQQISKADIINKISRIVPIALMIAGNEVGNASAQKHEELPQVE